MKLTKEFRSRLDALKVSGLRKQYEKAYTILGELGSGVPVTQAYRPESRIPNCRKYELPDGYRIVFQLVEGAKDEHLALFVGSHDEVEFFLNSHRGWIFDPQKHTLKELRLNTIVEEQINTVRSIELQPAVETPVAKPPVFAELSGEHLANAGLDAGQVTSARAFTDPDDFALTEFLDALPQHTSSILLSYITGSAEEREEIHALLSGERELVSTLTAAQVPALEASSEAFIDLSDIPEEKRAFDELPFEDWMLYLHPDQKPLVNREFNGPARLRGVSGSGKTVVAIHRARYYAQQVLAHASSDMVLFLTYNRSLADAVDRLFDRLCTAQERSRIMVSTVSKFCQDYIRFRTDSSPYWDEQANDGLFREVVLKHYTELRNAGFFQKTNPSQLGRDRDFVFLAEEIDYIFGRFVHTEAESYLQSDRTGRGRRLTSVQRAVILQVYNAVVERHVERKLFDPRDLARAAYGLLAKDEPTRQTYAAVIVDEVQDLTEIELKVARLLNGVTGSGLFLVGDGAQQIYKRGHSLQRIGINVVGRSFVLRKNYRNTREIFTAANAFKQACKLGQSDEQEAFTETSGIPPSSSGEKPLLMIGATPEQEWAAIVREVTYLVRRLKVAPNQICCMARNEWMREGMRCALEQSGIHAVSFRVEANFLPDAIPVSTLHNSKGHEFRAVFLAGLFDGAVPLSYTQDEQELGQEAALLYVAMTRAKELLYLSYARTDSGGRQLRESRFLAPMRPHLDVLELAPTFKAAHP